MSYKIKTPEEVQVMIAKKDVNFIDVRTPQERAYDGYIAGSSLIDIRSPDFDQELGALDKNETLILYCHAGNRSKTAAQKAIDAGFKDVCMIEGGIAEWESCGLPVEK
ncbi:MAG: rhodanese-like domain-containing protein [Methanosarcinales archaeon]|nr:rhodanese-like domain-containing protein [Methanosarcinales archaeon]